jgi:hypothetical protein
MNRPLTLAMAALATFAVLIPIIDSSAEARRRGRGAGIAAGIALGVVAGAAIANSRRANAWDRRGYRRSGWRQRCDRWLWQCDRGNDFACERFENRC